MDVVRVTLGRGFQRCVHDPQSLVISSSPVASFTVHNAHEWKPSRAVANE
jgi:hypothetical protein